MRMFHLGDPPTELDFRQGKNMWGHAIHSGTFRQDERPAITLEPYPWWKPGYKRDLAALNAAADAQDAADNARYYSFMAHSMYDPRIGMTVVWTGEQGDVRGTIYGYERARNVDDMFTLKVKVTGPVNGES